jgi:hypothetical protein
MTNSPISSTSPSETPSGRRTALTFGTARMPARPGRASGSAPREQRATTKADQGAHARARPAWLRRHYRRFRFAREAERPTGVALSHGSERLVSWAGTPESDEHESPVDTRAQCSSSICLAPCSLEWLGRSRAGFERRGRDSNPRTTLRPSTVFETAPKRPVCRIRTGVCVPGECRGE